jgi:hypothetical protein
MLNQYESTIHHCPCYFGYIWEQILVKNIKNYNEVHKLCTVFMGNVHFHLFY